MKIGIISDTHNEVEKTKKAIDIFKDEGIEKLIHLGDFTTPDIVYLFKGMDLSAVLGNSDKDIEGLKKAFDEIGGELSESVLEIKIDGINIGCYHEINSLIKEKLIKSEKYDVLLYGHTHIAEVKKEGKTICINPGALKRVIKPSVAILDTVTLKSDHIWF